MKRNEMKTNSLPLQQRQARNILSRLSPILAMLFLSLASERWAWGQVYSWITIAGNGTPGSADGTNGVAGFYQPTGVAVDSAGNIYVADRANGTIRKIVPVGTNWVVSTIARSFWWPTGVAVDSSGILYVAETYGDTIRKLAPLSTNWVVSTIAGSFNQAGSHDGIGPVAYFHDPNGIGVDGSGTVYVADGGNSTLRRMVQSGQFWVVSTIAGLAGSNGSADGTNSNAGFHYPSGAAPDNSGNIYVTDQDNSTIRKLAPNGTNWVVSTIAGLAGSIGTTDGTNSDARFYYPGGLAVDNGGNIHIADLDNNAIRKITRSGTNWVVSTIGGLCGYANRGFTDGISSAARFNAPNGVAVDSRGNVYVADELNNAIRRGIPLPVFQPTTLTNTTLTLTWSVAVGQVLQVQYTADMSQINWTNLAGQFVATNCTITVPDSVTSGPQRFYRVLVTP